MKNLQTILFAVLAIAIAVNFYVDYKRDLGYKLAIKSLSDSIHAKPVAEEPSPFDNISPDPLHDVSKLVVGKTTTISFEHTAHDFGRVESGPTYTASFKFTNTGHDDLFISNAEASCGCTVPGWPREPIKPGQSGEITVAFDSKGRVGAQLKTITVTANTDPAKTVLTINSEPYLKTQ